ncbi:DNA-binding response regulator, partial [Francisella tularensis subsp. holarctica]|nr:DNA-binding response regulator [Francisella tularensis subsp. holarctica]
LNSTENKIECLKSGSDDYRTKTFSIDELIYRLNILYKRTKQITESQTHKLSCGDFVLDELSNEVRRNLELILLQQREYKV